jgi:predicted ATPase
LYKKYQEELQRLTIPVISSFIVEEPEQNLFPDTQMELMDTLFSYCNGERKHELTVTTHSPYILNQLNLLFKRFDVKDKENVGVDFNEVSVYAINEGRVSNLKLQNAHLVNPEYLSAPLDKIYNLYEAYDKH